MLDGIERTLGNGGPDFASKMGFDYVRVADVSGSCSPVSHSFSGWA